MQIKKNQKRVTASKKVSSKKVSANKNYEEAQKHIKCAIDALAACGKSDEVAKDSIANLGVVLFDINASTNVSASYDDSGVISTEDEMTKFVHDNDIIGRVVTIINDKDHNWDLNTPELFAEACKIYFSKNLQKMISEYGYTTSGNAVDLVSNNIWNELHDEATSGDFDVDDVDEDISEPNDIDPEEWVDRHFSASKRSRSAFSPEARRKIDEELAALDKKYSPRDRGNSEYTKEYNAIMRKYRSQ